MWSWKINCSSKALVLFEYSQIGMTGFPPSDVTYLFWNFCLTCYRCHIAMHSAESRNRGNGASHTKTQVGGMLLAASKIISRNDSWLQSFLTWKNFGTPSLTSWSKIPIRRSLAIGLETTKILSDCFRTDFQTKPWLLKEKVVRLLELVYLNP